MNKTLIALCLLSICFSALASKNKFNKNQFETEVTSNNQVQVDNFPIRVNGLVKRIYPQQDVVFFTVGTAGYTYEFLRKDQQSFEQSYNLLLKAAELGWNVNVRRADLGSPKHWRDTSGNAVHYYTEYIYIDF